VDGRGRQRHGQRFGGCIQGAIEGSEPEVVRAPHDIEAPLGGGQMKRTEAAQPEPLRVFSGLPEGVPSTVMIRRVAHSASKALA
jgi:hypothetical protein